MALILEIRDRRGATTWHSLSRLPLTLGRGLSNDIILDDPYVDARHVRITPDDSGALSLCDLGSTNGVLANGVRTDGSIAAQAGTELRIGRTTLRFRDQDEALPPAIVESSYRVPAPVRWALTPTGSLALTGLVVGLTAFNAWLGSTERSSAGSVTAAAMTVLVVLTIWAGVWAIAVRGADRRFHMLAHTAVISAAFLSVMAYATVHEWLVFFFPDAVLVDLSYTVVLLLAIAVVVAGHLTVAGVQTPRHRWRTGFVVSGVLFLMAMLGTMVQDEKFSDVPKFPAQLKPISPRWVPTHTVDEFVQAMGEARAKADKAINR